MVISAAPDTSIFTPAELSQITTQQTREGQVEFKVTGAISPDLAAKIVRSVPKADQDTVRRTLAVQQARQVQSPAERGETLQVPQLCLFLDDELRPATKELFLDARGWNLLDYPARLTPGEFSIDHEADTYLIDFQGKKLTIQHNGMQEELDLGDAPTEWTINTLSRDLDRKLRDGNVRQVVLLEFLRRTLQYLVEERHIPLNDLVRTRFVLEKALRQKIRAYKLQAYDRGYQESLFGAQAAVETSFDYPFAFPSEERYAPHWTYNGRYRFNKHYYSLIGEMKGKGEEFECARGLDHNPQVKYWVRNLAGQPLSSFKLPTSTDNFYPDFVAQLKDGRILVVEYKGDDYVTNDDSKEKRNLGELWAEHSGGKALFLMAVEYDDQGRDVYRQIEDAIEPAA